MKVIQLTLHCSVGEFLCYSLFLTCNFPRFSLFNESLKSWILGGKYLPNTPEVLELNSTERIELFAHLESQELLPSPGSGLISLAQDGSFMEYLERSL
jgi:hypothetical protein